MRGTGSYPFPIVIIARRIEIITYRALHARHLCRCVITRNCGMFNLISSVLIVSRSGMFSLIDFTLPLRSMHAKTINNYCSTPFSYARLIRPVVSVVGNS